MRNELETFIQSAGGGNGWTFLDPSTLVKADPSALEVAPPADQGSGFWRYSWDASGANRNPQAGGNVLMYTGVIPGLTDFTTPWSVEIVQEVKNPNDGHLGANFMLCDSTLIGGLYIPQHRTSETLANDNTYSLVSNLNTTYPIGAGGSIPAEKASLVQFFNNPGATELQWQMQAVDAADFTSFISGSDQRNVVNNAAITGAVHFGLFLSSNTAQTATALVDARFKYRVRTDWADAPD
jgi:hypothetical protein